jgi:hypothetical protein
MAKITDYVREGFDRRRRPWDRTDLPEWWDLMAWAAVIGIIAALLLSAVLDRGGSSDSTADTAGGGPGYQVQALNPYSTSPSPQDSAPAGATASPSGAPADASAKEFTATAAVQVPMTGGGTAVVPAGARNVALAAARAEATGDRAGIPFVGTARSAKAPSTPQGSVIGEVTVTDPTITGNSQYLFTANITHGPDAKPNTVQIAVEYASSGYAVRAR